MVFIGGGTGRAPETAEEIDQQLVSATLWAPGKEPRECDLSNGSRGEGILWIDVVVDLDAADLLLMLERTCPGVTFEMLDDLVDPDKDPISRRWDDGAIRLASTFAVYPDGEETADDWTRKVTPSATVRYQPVELLAGDGWLVSRWHPSCLFCGRDEKGEPGDSVGKEAVETAVAKRWVDAGGDTAGDLGVLFMHELALTYAPAHWHFSAALEDWELRLYGVRPELDDRSPAQALTELWGARARLRDWLGPLNVAGLNLDIDRAWLPVARHDEVKAVDRRVDKALADLADLGDTLRSSFNLLHIKTSEDAREHHEAMQRRIEYIATGFLVPTLIVGFFGANTWVPGEHRHWGLTLMLISMAVLTCIVVSVLLLTRRAHDSRYRAARARANRRARRPAPPRGARSRPGWRGPPRAGGP